MKILDDISTTEENDLFAVFCDNSDNGFLGLNQNLEIIYSNKSAEKIFHYKKNELLSKSISVFDYRKSDSLLSIITEMKSEFLEIEKTLKKSNGQLIQVKIKIIKYSEDHKYALEIIDLSERIEERNKLYEHENRARYLDKMKAITKITAGVAHEVRNPLNSIMALVEVLKMEINENDELNIYLQQIDNQVERLAHLMQDLLDLGKTSQEDAFESLNLCETVNLSASTWENSQKELLNSVILEFDDSCSGKEIFADKNRLIQVFVNLLDNASQHSEDMSEIRIVVSIDNNQAKIQVIDSGKGIDESKIKNIFDPFVTSRKNGAGLGLSIVSNIIKEHKGSIDIINNPNGIGCRAIVVLPLLLD